MVDFSDTIKSEISMGQCLDMYCGKNRHRRYKCPIHGGKDYNLSFKEEYFKCWVCGASGSVIDFVKQYFRLDFFQAVAKIDYDFNLRLPLTKKITRREQLKIQQQQDKIKAEREEKKRCKLEKSNTYWSILGEWIRLDCNMKNYTPKSMDEPLNPLFIEALQKLSYYEYLLDCAEAEREDVD